MDYKMFNRLMARLGDPERLKEYKEMTITRAKGVPVRSLLRYGITGSLHQQWGKATLPVLLRVNLALDIENGKRPGETTEDFLTNMKDDSPQKAKAAEAIQQIAEQYGIKLTISQ